MARMTRSLPCALNDCELADRRDKVVNLLSQIDALEEQKREVSSGLATEIKTAKATLKGTAKEIRERSTMRDVECKEHKDDVRFCVDWIRQDTLEVVESRAMTEDEIARAKQGKLKLEGPKLVAPPTVPATGDVPPEAVTDEKKAKKAKGAAADA